MTKQTRAEERDAVDDVLEQWHRQNPALDVSAMGIVGRLQRAGHLLDTKVAEHLSAQGLEPWEFDVLATLRRAGEMTAGELTRASMVTSGAMTNRVDRLVKRGLVERRPDPRSRRAILIDLSKDGRDVVEGALVEHVDNLESLTEHLELAERQELARLLRRLLFGLGDVSVNEVS